MAAISGSSRDASTIRQGHTNQSVSPAYTLNAPTWTGYGQIGRSSVPNPVRIRCAIILGVIRRQLNCAGAYAPPRRSREDWPWPAGNGGGCARAHGAGSNTTKLFKRPSEPERRLTKWTRKNGSAAMVHTLCSCSLDPKGRYKHSGISLRMFLIQPDHIETLRNGQCNVAGCLAGCPAVG